MYNQSKIKQSLFIQARVGSTRLPAKVLKTLHKKSLLELVIDRFLDGENKFHVVVVLTSKISYPQIRDHLLDYLRRGRVVIYAGSEDDVLSRYYEAYRVFHGDIIIRATADNPLVSQSYLKKAVDDHIQNKADLTHYLG